MTQPPNDDTVTGSAERGDAGVSGAPEWAARVLHCPIEALVGTHFVFDSALCFGRVAEPRVHAVIADPKMSRRHATLVRIGLTVELRDEGSSNGTRVNGARVVRQVLQPGDIVRMGETLVEVDVVAPHAPQPASTLVGHSPAFCAALARADRAARSDLPILILGETGTGKDVLARYIHERSGRTGQLVAVNCAALPSGLVESTLFGHKKGAFTGATSDSAGFFVQASGGTLFLDELGELPFEHQAKLLRALDAREIVPVGATHAVRIDSRVLAATNVDVLAEAAQGGFRSDLYARLAGAVIRMPPLRARRGDIVELARHFIDRRGRTHRFSAQAAERLILHAWPRNVRELSATMQRLELELGERIEVSVADVDAVLDGATSAPSAAPPAPRRSAALEGPPGREELAERLASLRGNVSRLAALYGKDGKQIYRWLKRHGLDPRSYR